MLRYLARRILFFIPALFVITLLAFLINVSAPGDPVERLVAPGDLGNGAPGDVSAQQAYWTRKLGLDLPVFYLSVGPLSDPAGLASMYPVGRREPVRRLVAEYGDSRRIRAFLGRVDAAEHAVRGRRFEGAARLAALLHLLGRASGTPAVEARLNEIQLVDRLDVVYGQVSAAWAAVQDRPARWKNYVPVVRFHPANQYHRWLFGDGDGGRGIVRGDFGVSFATRRPIADVIGERMGWSVTLALLSILAAYLVSIPVGVFAARYRNGWFDRLSSAVLFILYALPVFWVATLLLMAFANPDAWKVFPASGVRPPQGYPAGASLFDRAAVTAPYLVLPLICYTYGALAFLSRTMRASMLTVLDQGYIRTARAKGLPEHTVLFRHALRNALLPLITVFANVFPFAISGSVVVESVFSIPGMGYETYQAVTNLDYPMITAVFTLTGVLTLTGYLLSDLLYAAADPRISFVQDNRPAS